jgi:MFS family permease
MATSGVIGLWGIGFFSIDLNRSVFRKVFEQEARDAGQAEWDRDVLRLALGQPDSFDGWAAAIKPTNLLNSAADTTDALPIASAALDLHVAGKSVSTEAVLAELDARGQSAEQRAQRVEFLAGKPGTNDSAKLVSDIDARATALNGRLTRWAGFTSMMLNLGAFVGIYGFSLLTHSIGRRPAFALAFLSAGISTALVFWFLNDVTDVFWMIPLMGCCLLSPFGGYAIYFPELFPTRLRSTGTSFCYNVGRFVAASGPYVLGLLTSQVFAGYAEPMRYAGVAMCSIFLLGILALPFAPETKGQPLPE